jgi:hypothetical protein
MIDDSYFKLDIARSAFYFGKFKYKMSVFARNVHYFRSIKTVDNFHKRLDRYSTQRDDGYFFLDDIQSLFSDKKTQTTIEGFVRWRESIVNTQLKFKIRINQSHILIYGNDLQLYDDLLTEIKDSVNPAQIEYYYVNSNPNYDRSIIYLQKPKRKFRIYLKSEIYSTSDREKLLKFMIDNNIYMCRSFNEWLIRNNSTNFFKNTSYSWDHFFFELDDETLITLILLKFDRLIRKVCTIEKR